MYHRDVSSPATSIKYKSDIKEREWFLLVQITCETIFALCQSSHLMQASNFN